MDEEDKAIDELTDTVMALNRAVAALEHRDLSVTLSIVYSDSPITPGSKAVRTVGQIEYTVKRDIASFRVMKR